MDLPPEVGLKIDEFLTINEMLDIDPDIDVETIVEERNFPKQLLTIKLGNNRVECNIEAGEIITEIRYYDGKELIVTSNEEQGLNYPIETSYYIMNMWQSRPWGTSGREYTIMGNDVMQFNQSIRSKYEISGLPAAMIGFPRLELDAEELEATGNDLDNQFFKTMFDSSSKTILYPKDLVLYCRSEDTGDSIEVYADIYDVNEIYKVLYWLATELKIWHPNTRFMIKYRPLDVTYDYEIVDYDWGI